MQCYNNQSQTGKKKETYKHEYHHTTCLKGICELLIRLMVPGLMAFKALHITFPSLRAAPKSPSIASPVRVSSHSLASSSERVGSTRGSVERSKRKSTVRNSKKKIRNTSAHKKEEFNRTINQHYDIGLALSLTHTHTCTIVIRCSLLPFQFSCYESEKK